MTEQSPRANNFKDKTLVKLRTFGLNQITRAALSLNRVEERCRSMESIDAPVLAVMWQERHTILPWFRLLGGYVFALIGMASNKDLSEAERGGVNN
jgi:hypothetical protein